MLTRDTIGAVFVLVVIAGAYAAGCIVLVEAFLK